MEKTGVTSMFYGARANTYANARSLWKNMTAAELILWERLRKNRLGVRFKAQHPLDIYIADFYCHRHKLVVEIDGESHKYQREYDENRTAEMKRLGLTVIRFTNEEVCHDIENVVNKIEIISNKVLALCESISYN